ncbi:MAG: 23S rRNA (adenine(2503)-C(2))-methyltransferase RlmN [Bacteroidales bacterium]|nr:23S rRNA (adenine(2503)-C(2))-methyltransferase RlmN [Bacteroidales bacterium]
MKQNIRNISFNELNEFISGNGHSAFRAKQIWEWIWEKNITEFQKMTNIPANLREMLEEKFFFAISKAEIELRSKDRTIKTLHRLYDNKTIETVLIPSKERVTTCLSTQTGCNLACRFCATGMLKGARNLDSGEMFDHFFYAKNKSLLEYKKNLSNIVFMGMGEPLLNYENLLKTISAITNPEGLNFSPQRITVSTVGIVEGIKRLADDNVSFHLAISLHAANDILRNSLMPVNKKHGISGLKEAIIYFHKATNQRITYEYVLLKNVNDSLKHASELAEFCKITPCKVNIIEYNSSSTNKFQASDVETMQKFSSFLEGRNMLVNIRKSRGNDIDAACGQLANKC